MPARTATIVRSLARQPSEGSIRPSVCQAGAQKRTNFSSPFAIAAAAAAASGARQQERRLEPLRWRVC